MILASNLPRPVLVVACAVALTVASPLLAAPQITTVSPAMVADGDVMLLDGAGFLPDASRYSVVLRDAQGLVALGEVISASPQTLQVVVHGLGRGSTAAEVVLHEGVRVPLVGSATATATTDAATWFQGSGVTAEAGPVAVLASPTASDPASTRPTKPGVIEVLCPGGGFSLDIPLDCKEITAKIRVGGDDPFDDFPAWWPGEREPTKIFGSIHDLWAGTWIGRLRGRALDDSLLAAEALASVLSAQFGVFGVEATANDEQGTAQVLLHGERMTETTGAALVTLVCDAQ